MANTVAATTTFNQDNYVGELFHITPKLTPFLSMLGGLGKYEIANAPSFTWQDDDNPDAEQPAIVQNADPTYSFQTRTERSNVVQIFQYGVEVGYTQMSSTGLVAAAATPVLGNQPVQNEMAHQLQRKLWRGARDVDYSFMQGTYANPANNSTGRKTRGLKNAITTNAVAAGGSRVNRSMFQELWREMYSSGAPAQDLVIFANIFNRQIITDIYGFVPESRTVGGMSIEQIKVDEIGIVGVAASRQMPTDEIYVVDMSFCSAVALPIKDRGVFFMEPKSSTGATVKYMLYGEMGLKYGPELFHGKITGTATS